MKIRSFLLYFYTHKKSLNLKAILSLPLLLISLNAYSVVFIGSITQPNSGTSTIKLVYGCYAPSLGTGYTCKLTFGNKTFNLPIQQAPLHYNPTPITLNVNPGTQQNVSLCVSVQGSCYEEASATFTATGVAPIDQSKNVFLGSITQPNNNEPVIKLVYGCSSSTLSWYECRLTVGHETFIIPKVNSSPSFPPHYQTSTIQEVEPGTHNINLCIYTNGPRGSFTCHGSASATFTVTSNTSKYKYEYDALGRLKVVDNVGKSTSSYEYDDADNRT